MTRSLALVCVFALSTLSGTAQAQTDVGPVVLALDDARVAQERYLMRLLKLPATSRLIDENAESCRVDSLEKSEACLRADNASETFHRPVLVLANAVAQNRSKPGLAELLCVGRGLQAGDPERQRILLWPGAFTLASAKDFIEDGRALEACIAAANAETAP